MSKIKKLLALTLALAMILSVSAFAGYKADTYADADKIDSDCEDAIELLYVLDIMKGDGKNFNPEASVTRAEMAKMIYVILNYGDDDKAVTYTGAKMFSDVTAGAWYEGYVNYAAATKLVQGRPDGTFGPMDPVTTAEAAKMLLTAIGYSAEGRGYVGANWDKNVLSDAAIIGLLDGYKSNVNTFAPRQWVAVMMENALDAKTYKTMVPSFSGLLTSGSDEEGIVSMGNKYYGIEVITAYAMATEKTSLYAKTFADEDCILFSNSKGDYNLEDTGLDVADLGQQFKIIIVDGDVVSCRNTEKSVVAESLLRDLEAKTVTATSGNKEYNKYVFTVDEFSGKFESTVNYIVLGQEGTTKVAASELKPNKLYAQANGKTENVPTTVKVIDKDADGLIDYVVYTEFYYADVDTVATSRAYGDYIKLENKDNQNIKYAGDSKLYVDDVIDCADELEEGNYVKYNWDHENTEFDIEVLPVVEDTLDRVTVAKKEVKIGGEEYVASDAATAYPSTDLLVKKYIGDTLIVAVDGDMLVVITTPDENTSLEEINAQLCVVTDTTDHYYTGWDKVKAIEIVTVNGTEEYVLANQKNHAEDDKGNENINFDEINVVDDYDALVKTPGGLGKYLYVYSINDYGKITLKEVAASDAGIDLLDEDNEYLDGYWVGTKSDWEISDELSASDELAIANTYFVLEDDELTVKTLEDLEGKTAHGMYYEGLYDYSSKSKLHTMIAGFIAVDYLYEDGDGSYLYLTDDVYSDDDDYYKAEVVFADGEAATITLDEDYTEAQAKALKMYTLYEYSVRNNEYKLNEINVTEKSVKMEAYAINGGEDYRYAFDADYADAAELVEKFHGDEIYVDLGGNTKLVRKDLTDCVIAIKTIVLDLDRDEKDVIEVTYDIEFVTLDELKEMDDIFNSTEENDDWYFSDFRWEEEDVFYVEVYRVTEECQEIVTVVEGPSEIEFEAADAAVAGNVLYVDGDLTAYEKAAAIKSALEEAGCTEIVVTVDGEAVTASAVDANGLTVNYGFAEIALKAPGTGNCYVMPYLTNATKAGINVGLVFDSNVSIAAGELSVVLYAGDTAVAEATNVKAIAEDGQTSVSFYGHDHDSESWNGNNFVAGEELVPTDVKVYVNGVLFDEMSVSITADAWAAYVAKAADGCGCSECK